MNFIPTDHDVVAAETRYRIERATGSAQAHHDADHRTTPDHHHALRDAARRIWSLSRRGEEQTQWPVGVQSGSTAAARRATHTAVHRAAH